MDHKGLSTSWEKVSRTGKCVPKWAIYSAGGVGVLVLVSLIKALLPVIGMAFLLVYIWSQSTATRKY